MAILEEQNDKRHLFREVDLLQLLVKVLSRWKFIVRITLCFMLLGVIMAFSMIKSYTAEVVVAPESSSSSAVGGGLSSLASLAGINMGSMGGDDAIYPLLYPDLVYSLPFLSSLFDVHVVSLNGEIDTTYYYYKDKLQKKSWTGYIKKIPKDVLRWTFSLFSPKKEMVGDPSVFNPYNLSEKQLRMIDNLSGSISMFVDKKTNVITLSYTDQDPLIAATMVDTIMCRLQERITAYRTQKAMADCAYIEKLYNESKVEYEKAQERYADYVDRNLNVTQKRHLVEVERLEADKDLKNTLYTQWAQQLQLAKAKVQEYTPAFTTLKPAAIPALPSSTRKLMVILFYTFIGGALAVAYVLLKDGIIDIFHKLFRGE